MIRGFAEVVEYYSDQKKKWEKTTIRATEGKKVKIECRDSWIMDMRKLRPFAEEEAEMAAPAESVESAGHSTSRARGVYDGTMNRVADELLKNCGTVEQVLVKFVWDFGTGEDQRTFPKQPTKGVCYIGFNTPPGTHGVKGHVHPWLGRATVFVEW